MKSSSLASPDGARRGKQPSVPLPWRQVLGSFIEFQLEHRGVSARTAGGYSWILRRFAAHVTSSKGDRSDCFALCLAGKPLRKA
jgi:hypothetical protein